MGDSKWIPSALFVLAAAVLGTGLLFYFGQRASVRPEVPTSSGARSVVVPLEADSLRSSAPGRDHRQEDEVASLRGELEVKKRREGENEKRIAWLEAELESLRAQIRLGDQSKSERVSRILAAIEKLQKQGLAAMLEPAALAQLTSDLREIGPQGLGPVLDLLANGDANAKILAAKLLEDLGDPRAVPALSLAARSEDERVASMASHALAFLKSGDALATLLDLSKDSKSEAVRLNSIYGVCLLGDARGFDAALAYVQNSESNEAYVRALSPGIFAMTDARSWPVGRVLAERLGSHEVFGPLAITYLQGLGTAEARNLLQTWSTDMNRSAALRDAALLALTQ